MPKAGKQKPTTDSAAVLLKAEKRKHVPKAEKQKLTTDSAAVLPKGEKRKHVLKAEKQKSVIETATVMRKTDKPGPILKKENQKSITILASASKKAEKDKAVPDVYAVKKGSTEQKEKGLKEKLFEENCKGKSQLPLQPVLPVLSTRVEDVSSKEGKLNLSIKRKVVIDKAPDNSIKELLGCSMLKISSLKEKTELHGKKAESGTKLNSLFKVTDGVKPSGRKIIPLKISDGHIRSPFYDNTIDRREAKTLKVGQSKGVCKISESISDKEQLDVSTDTADLVSTFVKEPATYLDGRVREVQDFLYRQESCLALKDVVERFPLVDPFVVTQLWESAYYFAEEKKNKVRVGDLVFEVLDEKELLDAIGNIEF